MGHYSNTVACLHTQTAQSVSDTPRTSIQFSIGERAFTTNQRNFVGPHECMGIKVMRWLRRLGGCRRGCSSIGIFGSGHSAVSLSLHHRYCWVGLEYQHYIMLWGKTGTLLRSSSFVQVAVDRVYTIKQ